ncbi:MAG: hypothetical protein RJA81_1790, partial [Planctomycetota bacterium]
MGRLRNSVYPHFTALTLAIICGLQNAAALGQSSQNPSPMVEHVREHPRLDKQSPAGDRKPLRQGTLYIPKQIELQNDTNRPVTLIITFHCGDWIPELASSRLKTKNACVHFQLGAGSSRYAKPFQDEPQLFQQVIIQIESELKSKVENVVLVGWSAGYGAIREILRDPSNLDRISHVILLDGLHASYVSGKPGPKES